MICQNLSADSETRVASYAMASLLLRARSLRGSIRRAWGSYACIDSTRFTLTRPLVVFGHGSSRSRTTTATVRRQPDPPLCLPGSPVRHYTSSTTVAQDYPAHTVFPMPALSPTMESGTITAWHKQEGDAFIAGDVLCSIETDKASVDFEAQDDGVLAKILHQADAALDIVCGTPICVAVEEHQAVAAFADYTVAHDSSAESGGAASHDESTPSQPTPPHPTRNVPSILLPAARHLAESRGLNATVLSGSGKGGRVTKGDVLQAIADGTLPPLVSATESVAPPAPATTTQAATTTAATKGTKTADPTATVPTELPVPHVHAAEGSFADTPNSKMRKIIASRLTESKATVPHFYTSMEIPLDAILALRKQLASQHDVKVSVNDFIIRSSALALRDVPEVNGTYDAHSDTVRLNDSIDVSVAVATPTGLITPIIFQSDQLGLSALTATIRDLATRARDGKLAPHEYQGGTFSVSNLGMFGVDEFSAVINPPQAAILAVGGGARRVVPGTYVVDAPENRTSPTVHTILTGRLSADRRVVDEATAALFLAALERYLRQPALLML